MIVVPPEYKINTFTKIRSQDWWLIFLHLEPSIFALSQWLASVQFNGTDAFMHQSFNVQIFKGENIERKKYPRRTLCKRRPSQVTMAELLKIETLQEFDCALHCGHWIGDLCSAWSEAFCPLHIRYFTWKRAKVIKGRRIVGKNSAWVFAWGNLATWQPSGQDGRWTVVPHTSHPCPECLPRTCRLDLCWEDSLSLDLTDFMAILIDSVSVMQSLEYGGQHCAL